MATLLMDAATDAQDAVTVRFVGNLDTYTAPGLRRRMGRHDLASGRVVLDVSGVTLVDSAGLGTLMSFANRAGQEGSRLVLICTPRIAKLLELAQLGDVFDLRVVAGGSPAGAGDAAPRRGNAAQP